MILAAGKDAWKFERHRHIAEIFRKMKRLDILNAHGVCFGGGTAIAMCYDEVRQSDDIDFMVPDDEFPALSRVLRDLPCFEYAEKPQIYINSYTLRFNIEGIKVEFVRTADFPISSIPSPFGFNVLDIKALMYAKLLANENRYEDRAFFSRDMVDLGILLRCCPEACDLILNSEFSKKFHLDEYFLKGLSVLARNWKKSFAMLSVREDDAQSLMRVLGKTQRIILRSRKMNMENPGCESSNLQDNPEEDSFRPSC